MKFENKIIPLFITIALIFCFSIACNNKIQDDKEKDDQTEISAKKEISAKAIERFNYNDYILSPDAEKEVQSWTKFLELETQISYLKTADIAFFTEEKDTLKNFIDSLRISVPENIKTNPVNARITALETTLLKLNNDLNLDNYSAEKKLKSIKELLIANSNLIFVINKKLEFDKNDIGRPEGEGQKETFIEEDQ